MASLQNTANYVKFVRGTRTAWEALKSQGEIYNDTLYFIYEAQGASTGVLYLGTTQIGGTDGEQPTPVNLADLSDVDILNREQNDILVYNGTQWVNSSIEEIINLDLNVFELDDLDEISLKGFKAAATGTIPQKNEDGSISWIKVNEIAEIAEIKKQIEEETISETEVKTLITEEIAKVDHLSYEKVESLDDALASLETNKIYLVPAGDIEDNKYDEYMVIDGELEPVGAWSVDLDNYVTTENFDKKVGELNQAISNNNDSMTAVNSSLIQLTTDFTNFSTKVGDLSKLNTYIENATLVEQVNHLTEQLQWQEIVE